VPAAALAAYSSFEQGQSDRGNAWLSKMREDRVARAGPAWEERLTLLEQFAGLRGVFDNLEKAHNEWNAGLTLVAEKAAVIVRDLDRRSRYTAAIARYEEEDFAGVLEALTRISALVIRRNPVGRNACQP